LPTQRSAGASRILVVNPVRSRSLNELSQRFFQSKASPGFEVTCENLDEAPDSIESSYDEAVAAGPVAQRIARAAGEGFGAVIINCFLDPGLHAAREVSTIPVVGAGESAIRMALTLGERFSIIDVGRNKYVSRSPTVQVRSMGLAARFASIRGIGVPVLELNEQPDLTVKKIVREARLAVTEDGADVIVLGCTGLARLVDRVRLDVPVINPALSALRIAEALVSLRLMPRGGLRSPVR